MIAGAVVFWLPGMVVTDVVVWLPRLFAADRGSEFYCHIWSGLATVCLCIQSLISLFGRYLNL